MNINNEVEENFNREVFYSSRYQFSQEQIDTLINHVTNEKDKSKLNDLLWSIQKPKGKMAAYQLCKLTDADRDLLEQYNIILQPSNNPQQYIVNPYSYGSRLDRKQTKEKVFEILSNQITKDSKITKGALMRYVRENFEGQSVYSDVGRVASKIIKLETSRTGRWKVCTTARHIRRK